tara:strand:- start:282 stop:743 length:462 start_codon:yes stop_codon:yes gene_type:complete
MTRKKYDRDYEGEAIQEIWGNDEDSDEEEVEDEEPYDPWDDVQRFIDKEIQYIPSCSWIHRWFDATDIIRLSETKDNPHAMKNITEYLFPHEDGSDVYMLLDIVWALLEECRIEPTIIKLYSVTLELLEERTKYFWVNDTCKHRSIVSRNFFR